MEQEKTKNNKNLIVFTIVVVAGVATYLWLFQLQINKMDRKLTCLYNAVNALPYVVVPELRADRAVLQKQIDYLELSCDKGYIFSGILK